jgi:hypothetical protein
MPKRIPIKAAKDVAKQYDCRQVIIMAWDGKLSHVVTYGVSKVDCEQAAMGGNLMKKTMGWPDNLCATEASRVTKLVNDIKSLQLEIAQLRPVQKEE